MKTLANTRTHHQGFSLAEVLVAIALMVVGTVGTMVAVTNILRYAQYDTSKNTAYFLAQEGIEAIHKLRADGYFDYLRNDTGTSWDWVKATVNTDIDKCFKTTGCGIDWNDDTININKDCAAANACQLRYKEDSNARGRYSHQTTGTTASRFTRVIKLEEVTEPTGISVHSEVSWNEHGHASTIVLQTYLHDIYDQSP